MRLCAEEQKKQEPLPKLYVDCANGVGINALSAFTKLLGDRLPIEALNTNTDEQFSTRNAVQTTSRPNKHYPPRSKPLDTSNNQERGDVVSMEMPIGSFTTT
jgi:hypothetical protein